MRKFVKRTIRRWPSTIVTVSCLLLLGAGIGITYLWQPALWFMVGAWLGLAIISAVRTDRKGQGRR